MSHNPILWKPAQEQIEKTQLESFRKQVNMRFDIDIKDYADLHKWSINNIEDFWNNCTLFQIFTNVFKHCFLRFFWYVHVALLKKNATCNT